MESKILSYGYESYTRCLHLSILKMVAYKNIFYSASLSSKMEWIKA